VESFNTALDVIKKKSALGDGCLPRVKCDDVDTPDSAPADGDSQLTSVTTTSSSKSKVPDVNDVNFSTVWGFVSEPSGELLTLLEQAKHDVAIPEGTFNFTILHGICQSIEVNSKSLTMATTAGRFP